MPKNLRIVRTGHEIALVSIRKGRTYLAMLLIEAVIFAVYFAWIAAVEGDIWNYAIPLSACIGIMAWTTRYVRPDVRLSFDIAARTGRLIRISPLTGRQTSTPFPIEAVEGVGLRRVGHGRATGLEPCDYAIGVAMLDGRLHEFPVHGALMTCRETLERFCKSAGLSPPMAAAART